MTGNEPDIRVHETQSREAGAGRVVRIDGELRLETVARWRDVLCESLHGAQNEAANSVGPVILDVTGVASIDLCGLQLICSAHRTFRSRQLAIGLQGATLEFRRTARAAGYLMQTAQCPYRRDSDCLWKE